MISTEDWTPLWQYDVPAETDTNEAPSHNLVFTPDGSLLIGTDFSFFGEGRIVFMDGTTLEHLHEIPDAHDTGIGHLALNDDGTLLASAGLDGLVKVWDVTTRSLLHEARVTSGWIGGVTFMDNEQHLAVTNMRQGTLDIITIDPEELLDIARSRVTRGFTETECAAHRIDPCPTLEDIRAR